MTRHPLLLAALLSAAGFANAEVTYQITPTSSLAFAGSLDLGMRHVGTAAGTDWSMASSGPPYTRLSLGGRKTFDDNLYSFFYVEHRFRANTGENAPGGNVSASTEVQLYRQVWIGVGGKEWGEVRAGKMLNVLQEFNGGYEPWRGGTTVANVHTGGINSGVRQNNTVYYKSPDFSGVRLHLSASGIENNTNNATIANQKTLWSTGVQYKAGPVSVAGAIDRGIAGQKTSGLYGRYDFGVAQLMTQWERGDAGPNTASVARKSFSAVVPDGKLSYMVGYLSGSDEKKNRLGVGVEYYIDKQLGFYSDLGFNRGDGWTAAQRKTQFDVGFRVGF